MTEDQVMKALQALDSLGMIQLVKPSGNYYQIHCPNRDGHLGGEDKKPSCGVLLRDQYINGKKTPCYMVHMWYNLLCC